MNPDLRKLQPYPFEKLAALKAGVSPPAGKDAINLSIGEPQHTTPTFIVEELITHMHGLSNYPVTKGSAALREAIAHWLARRFALPQSSLDPDRHILPVNGTREALFAFAQAVIDRAANPLVLMPNPFYQIYEGAALLAGAEPWFLNTTEKTGFIPDFDTVPARAWERCQLLYVCSPANPTGAVMDVATFENAKPKPAEIASQSARPSGQGMPSAGSHKMISAPPIASARMASARRGMFSLSTTLARITAHTGAR